MRSRNFNSLKSKDFYLVQSSYYLNLHREIQNKEKLQIPQSQSDEVAKSDHLTNSTVVDVEHGYTTHV